MLIYLLKVYCIASGHKCLIINDWLMCFWLFAACIYVRVRGCTAAAVVVVVCRPLFAPSWLLNAVIIAKICVPLIRHVCLTVEHFHFPRTSCEKLY